MHIKLPTLDGALVDYRLTGTSLKVAKPEAPFNRIAYSAAHVVADPLRSGELGQPCAIDWDRTIEYRRYLLEQGLGIAEAMDTAQRGMGLSWHSAKELIVRTLNETRDIPGALIASGCGTDHLPVSDAHSCEDVIKAYLTQIESVQRAGGPRSIPEAIVHDRLGKFNCRYTSQ